MRIWTGAVELLTAAILYLAVMSGDAFCILGSAFAFDLLPISIYNAINI